MSSHAENAQLRSVPIEAAPGPRTARFALRQATAEAHERLDRLYSRFDLSKKEDYGAFLLAHAPAYLATEHGLDAAGAADLAPGWEDRLRAGALIQDIAELGLKAPQPAAPPLFGNEAQMLGALYVLEGSRLGGAVLIRQVGDGLPTAFLTPGNPVDWRAFVSLLDLKLRSESSLAEATAAALAVFALFEQSARQQWEPTSSDR